MQFPTVAPRRLGTVFFEIVHGCQLTCLGCPISGLKPKVQKISLEVADRCFRNLDVDVVENLALYGYGEPFLHPELPGLFTIVEAQQWRASSVEISTNAQEVDWEQVELILRQHRLTDLVVSCDGDGTPELYEALRPPSRWSRFIEFLERASALRDRYCPTLRLRTRTCVPDWSKRFDWEPVLRPHGFVPQYRHYQQHIGSTHNMTGRTLSPAAGSCVWVESVQTVAVNIDGTIVPCCIHPRAGDYGSLQNRTFSEIFLGEKRAHFREQLISDRSAIEACRDCEWGEDAENVAVRTNFLPEQAFDEGLVPIQRLTPRGRRGVVAVDTDG